MNQSATTPIREGEKPAAQSTPSSHRLPTISASQALQRLNEPGGRSVSTGLSSLDRELGNSVTGSLPQPTHAGGYAKGQITEIYGPPAAGKTALGLHATLEALRNGSHVVWLDASKPLYGPRLAAQLQSKSLSKDHMANFHHYTTSTLPHLLALICHPPASFPPPSTALLILDGVSSLFTTTYPDPPIDSTASGARKKSDSATWAANRKYAVMADFLSKLTRLAAIRDLAVVLISQSSLKVRTEYGAILRPAIWTKSWSDSVQNRIVVFRDFFHGQDGKRKKGVRFAAVVKIAGASRTRIESVVPFRIEGGECQELAAETVSPAPEISTVLPRAVLVERKRKREEIADSQSDDSEDDLLDPFDRQADDGDQKATQLRVSYGQATETDPDLAEFEAAMEAGFDDI